MAGDEAIHQFFGGAVEVFPGTLLESGGRELDERRLSGGYKGLYLFAREDRFGQEGAAVHEPLFVVARDDAQGPLAVGERVVPLLLHLVHDAVLRSIGRCHGDAVYTSVGWREPA